MSDWDRDPVKAANDFFGPLVPGMLGCEFTDVTEGPRRRTDPRHGQADRGDGLPVRAGGHRSGRHAVRDWDTWQCAAENTTFTTIELKTNFLGSAREGETVEGRATPRHVGRTTQVWDCEVRNLDTDRTIALFRNTQMILPRRG